jgi:hypothetical protein
MYMCSDLREPDVTRSSLQSEQSHNMRVLHTQHGYATTGSLLQEAAVHA